MLTKKEYLIAGILVALKVIIHLAVATNYELHRDALLYIALGDHPAWGYFSVPPFVAWVAEFSRYLFGDSELSLRLFPALAGGLSVWLIALMVKEFGGNTYAIILAGMSYIFSISFLRTNSLLQPVCFDQLFWLLNFWILVRMVRTSDARYWLALGLCWGFGALNKYTMALPAISSFLAILLTFHRKLIFSRWFPAGMMLAFLIFLPNLIWQYQHGFPLIHHMQELQRTQLIHVSITGFLAAQIFMNANALVVWVAGLWAAFSMKEIQRFRFVGITSLFILLILILLKGKAYYSLGLYPALFALGATALGKWLAARKLVFPRMAIMVLVVGISIPFIPIGLPLLKGQDLADYSQRLKNFIGNGFLVWEDGRERAIPQDFADMTGWKELAEITTAAWNSLSEEEKLRTSVYAENYGRAGAVHFYCREAGVPEPISFNDNFLLWAPDSVNSDILIYINEDNPDIRTLFNKIEVFDYVKDPWFREGKVPVLICREPKEGFRDFYSSKLNELRSGFKR